MSASMLLRALSNLVPFSFDPFSVVLQLSFLFFLQEQLPYQVGKKRKWVRQRFWCVRRGSSLQDRLPVKFQDVKFTVLKFKHEIFVRIDMKHSYFSIYFIICSQSIVSVIEIIIACLLFAKN